MQICVAFTAKITKSYVKWLKSKVPVRMAGLKIFGLTVSILWVVFYWGGGGGGGERGGGVAFAKHDR